MRDSIKGISVKEELNFRISSALKNIIGRDLITDDYIAVFELVKNSYDAFASKVKIEFQDDKIIIEDNGKGMTIDDINKKWLFVAYSAKKEGTEDVYNKEINIKTTNYRDKINIKRYYAGAKGIGRFSCDRLGNKLFLYTKTKSNKRIEKLYIDWEEFDKEAKDEFINIPVEHETIDNNKFKHLEHGTIIEITSLNSNWNRDKLQNLKYSLEKLINPIGDGNKFEIELICEREKNNDKNEDIERNKVNGLVKNFIFEVFNIKTTHVIVIIKDDKIITELIDRGELIYKIEEENTYNLIEDAKYSLFFLNRAAKYNFSLIMGIRPVQFGSIFLFKNGFRVYPYGNVGDDSLKIDRRKQQGYKRYLGTRELLGRIEITTNSDEFKEASSRDGGLINTAGYKQLINSFRNKCLKRLENYVVKIQWAYNIDEDLKKDQYKDNLSTLDKTIHKTRVIKLVSRLSNSKGIKLLDFNKNFLNIANQKIEEITPSVFKDLTYLANETGDNAYFEKILNAEKEYLKLIKEKEDAENKANEEIKKRIEVEQKLKDEVEKREKVEEEKKNAEVKIKHQQNQVLFLKSLKTIEFNDVLDLTHSIGIKADNIKKRLLLIKNILDKKNDISANELLPHIKAISLSNDQILSFTNYVTKGNFLKAIDETNDNIVKFISNYINDIIKKVYEDYEDIKINVVNDNIKYITAFKPINITTMIDNLISNSRKKKAKRIDFIFKQENYSLYIICRDYGKTIDDSIKDVNIIFEEGFTTTNGSGLGLSHIKKIVQELNAIIDINKDFKGGFELIIKLPERRKS